jgi:SAM-dependent methyltransferase
VRRAHLEAFAPVCPACAARGAAPPLRLAAVWAEADGHVLQGALHCTDPACLREYPIVDGVPVIVADLRAHLGHNPLQFLMRDDLAPELMSMLGDAAGPGSALDALRQRISHYAVDAYGPFDPAAPAGGSSAAAVGALLDLRPGPLPADGLAVDLGCAVGGTTRALAARAPGLVLGVDLDLSMLRIGARALQTGRARYLRRRVGLVYDLVDHEVPADSEGKIDLWMADALALPLPPGRAALISAMQLLDCVPDPPALLAAIAQALAPGGLAALATPFDWSAAATPMERWLGGHSQRGPTGGLPEPVLRWLLHPERAGLEGLAEAELDWRVRVHDRSELRYRSFGVLARRPAAEPAG